MPDADETQRGSAFEVFRIFLIRGLISFGGPVAHLGYFRETFVERRRWLSDAAYADLIALCQFLPGPASSQVGLAIGLMRAGYLGMLAAFLAFTLPSAVLLFAFAGAYEFLSPAIGSGWIAGLKAAAVAVVANALLGMAKSLTPDRNRASIAAAAMIVALALPTAFTQIGIILLGALAGLFLVPPEAVRPAQKEARLTMPLGKRGALVFLALFALLLVAAIFLRQGEDAVSLAARFYQAGALVFGGGHVVLPLLEAETVATGLVERDAFLAGYGAAQAVPGPLFSFAAYLGALAATPVAGLAGAVIALVAIFLPGALLVLAALPFWHDLQHLASARKALAGVNAAVVGILAAALYDPVFTAGITSREALIVAVAAFIALFSWRVPAWAVVVAAALAGLGIL
ncbi:chromate efflux transporter [Afifella pfennigii]|uniref:chromate efflux transporter n=1 Tax=Afifella pfennigii TaxID=209897 RepID=UPI00047D44FA|nr:chromate efflux transporter [Afifella pfennigii]